MLGGVHRGDPPDAVVRARQSVPVPVPIRHELQDLAAFVQWRRLRDSMRAAVVSLAAWVPGHNSHTLGTETRVWKLTHDTAKSCAQTGDPKASLTGFTTSQGHRKGQRKRPEGRGRGADPNTHDENRVHELDRPELLHAVKETSRGMAAPTQGNRAIPLETATVDTEVSMAICRLRAEEEHVWFRGVSVCTLFQHQEQDEVRDCHIDG